MGSGASTMASAATKEKVAQLIKDNKIMVFSKSYCPYCDTAKSTLNKMGLDYKRVELDEIPDGSQIQAYLQQITGQRTVPNIFVRERHVGGCDATLDAVRRGTFQALVDGKSDAESAFKLVKL
ncbi:glutaredoxin [Hyaloraphidium curvatum]|nr:glutaredoxin [Hyaloraphidium curvatum]